MSDGDAVAHPGFSRESTQAKSGFADTLSFPEMSAAFLDHLRTVFPPDRLLTAPATLAAYESDALTAFQQRPLAVVIPVTQEEVIAAVKACHRFGVPFVARGSGTSLSGGSLPSGGQEVQGS
jgi:hypothetical protein